MHVSDYAACKISLIIRVPNRLALAVSEPKLLEGAAFPRPSNLFDDAPDPLRQDSASSGTRSSMATMCVCRPKRVPRQDAPERTQ